MPTDGNPTKGWLVIAALAIYGAAITYTAWQWVRLLAVRRRLKRQDPAAVATLTPAFRLLGVRAIIILATLQAAASLLRD